MNLDDYAAALNETPALLRHELDALRTRYRESQRWVAAKTWSDLCELSAQFCEGKLSRTPDHDGPRAEETVRIAEPLGHANRRGYLTICSQPGEDGAWQQRAAVEGWAPSTTADQLRKLFAGTRIQVQVADKRRRRSDYSTAVDVSRSVDPDGAVQVHTSFGAELGHKEHFVDLGRKDLTKNAVFVTVYDPQWGDHNLLWERLSVPDWDNPPPPAQPYQPPAKQQPQTTSQTATSGGAMASIEEVKAGINQSNDTASNSLGALQQAASDVEQAQQMLMQSVEGSSQNDQQEALALYAQALESINEAQQGVQMATQSAEQVAGRL